MNSSDSDLYLKDMNHSPNFNWTKLFLQKSRKHDLVKWGFFIFDHSQNIFWIIHQLKNFTFTVDQWCNHEANTVKHAIMYASLDWLMSGSYMKQIDKFKEITIKLLKRI